MLPAAVPAAAQDMVLRAGRFQTAESALRGPLMVVRGGVIESVREGGLAPRGLPVRSWGEESVVTRGLVDAHTHLGLRGESDEVRLAVTPDVRAADAFHPTAGERRAVLAAGITTLLVAPGDRNLVGGRIAEVKPAPPEMGGWRLLDRDRGLAVSLVETSRMRGRAPTSLAGQLMELRSMAASERLPSLPYVAVRVREAEETLAVLDLSSILDLAVPVGLVRSPELVEKGSLGDLVFGPLTPGAGLLDLAAPAGHARAGLDLLFGTGWQAPGMLRMQALQAVRHGMPAEAARRALTGGAL